MVGAALEPVGDHRVQPHLDRFRGSAGGQAGAVGQPEHMRIDRDRRLAEGLVEDDIGGLAADAGQCLQRRPARGTSPPWRSSSIALSASTFLALVRYSPMLLMWRADPLLAQGHHGCGASGPPRTAPGGLVDAVVRRLGGQNHRHQQR